MTIFEVYGNLCEPLYIFLIFILLSATKTSYLFTDIGDLERHMVTITTMVD